MTKHDFLECVVSYCSVAIGVVSDADLMAIGAGILLIARLLVDVPKAYKAVRKLFSKDTPNVKRKR
jgi:hypothetical protein